MIQTQLGWTRGYLSRSEGDMPGTQTADYRLSDLVNRGLISAHEGRGLLIDAGLVDLFWQVMWADNDATPDEELEARIGGAQGYAVFMHGWTGNHAIWESIPGLVVTSNRQIVAIALD